MKAKFKAFTLVELIIVMAILTILMAAIINMFKPIRATYVDSTLYEARRTTQNGIIQYIGESVRYATDMGIYNSSNISDAVEEFANVYCRSNPSADKDDVMKAAEVIIIDNTATIASGEVRLSNYQFNGNYYMGRVLRRKNVGSSTLSENLGTGCRLALGPAYYGASSYAIRISKPDEITSHLTDTDEINAELADWSADEGILINVASTIDYGNTGLQKNETIVNAGGGTYNNDVVSTEGLVLCPNVAKLGGIFDVMKDPPSTPSSGGSGSGSDSDSGSGSGSGSGYGASSNNDSMVINGVKSDDTVGAYVGGGGAGGGGGTGGSGGSGGSSSYTDTEEYTPVTSPNIKIYIVFLNEKV